MYSRESAHSYGTPALGALEIFPFPACFLGDTGLGDAENTRAAAAAASTLLLASTSIGAAPSSPSSAATACRDGNHQPLSAPDPSSLQSSLTPRENPKAPLGEGLGDPYCRFCL